MFHKFKQKKFARQMLISLYGINTCIANKIIGRLALHPQTLGHKLVKPQIAGLLGHILDSLRIGFRLRLIVFSRICLQLFTKSYRGIRRLQGLPTKGQRTHANGKTTRRLKASGTHLPFKFKWQKQTEYEQQLMFSKNKKFKNQSKINLRFKGKSKEKQKPKQKPKSKSKKKIKKK